MSCPLWKKISIVHYSVALKYRLSSLYNNQAFILLSEKLNCLLPFSRYSFGCVLSITCQSFQRRNVNLTASVKTLWLSSLTPNIQYMWVKLHIQLHKMWDKVEFQWNNRGIDELTQAMWQTTYLEQSTIVWPIGPVERLHNGVSFVEISAVGTFAALSSITFCHESMGFGHREHMDRSLL